MEYGWIKGLGQDFPWHWDNKLHSQIKPQCPHWAQRASSPSHPEGRLLLLDFLLKRLIILNLKQRFTFWLIFFGDIRGFDLKALKAWALPWAGTFSGPPQAGDVLPIQLFCSNSTAVWEVLLNYVLSLFSLPLFGWLSIRLGALWQEEWELPSACAVRSTLRCKEREMLMIAHQKIN